jgi:hypothetical protein
MSRILLSRRTVVLSGGLLLTSSYAYVENDKRLEILKIKQDAILFAETGIITIDSPITTQVKRAAWYNIIKPHMISKWIKTISNYDETKDIQSQLEQPIHGKTYNLTSTNSELVGLPKLITDSYRVQCIIGYMIDPSFKLVDFGNQTHWKYRLLRDSLPIFMYESITNKKSKSIITLEGSDQSWHITVVKNKHGETGKPLPWATHIDGGENAVFIRNGWPAINIKEEEAKTDDKLTVDEKILLILLHQLAILFYCETPGRLGVEEGATGFFPYSHRAVINVFRKILDEQKDHNIPHSRITSVLRLFGKENANDLKQIVLPENQMLLAFSTMVHSPMWSIQSMENNEVRVIQNCKIKFDSDIRKAPVQIQRELINTIPKDSILRKLASNNLQDQNDKILTWTNEMYEKYHINKG